MLFACKKDINPVVTFTVVDTTGTALEKARVYTHPCLDGVNCDTARVNVNFIKEGLTDASGQITWEFPYSAIIDVFAQYTPCDTPDVYCLYSGQTVARFESKRSSKNEENEYSVRVVVREEKSP